MSDVVFISWSKQPSDKLAQALKAWIADLFPSGTAWLSKDIGKGREWGSEIKKGLSEACFGIICITPENINERWILFEAGALYSKFEVTRVAPILFDVESSTVGLPLMNSQCVLFSEEEMLKLARDLNNYTSSRFTEDYIVRQAKRLWPELQQRSTEILNDASLSRSSNRNTFSAAICGTNPISVGLESALSTIDFHETFSYVDVSIVLNFNNHTTSPSPEIEAIHMYWQGDNKIRWSNYWHWRLDGVRCPRGASDLESYTHRFFIRPHVRRLLPGIWAPILLQTRERFAIQEIDNLGDVCAFESEIIVRVSTAKGIFDTKIPLKIPLDDIPF